MTHDDTPLTTKAMAKTAYSDVYEYVYADDCREVEHRLNGALLALAAVTAQRDVLMDRQNEKESP